MREIPVSERQNARFILLGFVLLLVLPYLIAPAILPSGSVWGGLLSSADDQNVHLMWARQAQSGHFFFRDLFTTESLLSGEKPLFFNVLPALMGILALVFRVDVVFPYHFLRVALGALALWQLHELSQSATQHEAKWSRARQLTLFLAAFTTGAGFLMALPGFSRFLFIDRPDAQFPLMPEAFLLLSGFAYPLNIASFGLLALIFRKIIEKTGPPIAFIAAFLLSNIHTYDALPLLTTTVIWLAWQLKNRDKNGALVALATIVGALLPVIYQFLVFRGSQEFRLKALTVTAPPDVLSHFLTLSPLLLLAMFGLKRWRELPAIPLLCVWIVAVFALVYAPTSVFSFARKMIEGVQIPLVILAGIGLSELLSRFSTSKTRKTVAALIFAVLLLSPLQFFGWLWNNTLENNGARYRVLMPPLALSRGDADALKAIAAQSGDGAVLCLPYIGSYVPRATEKWTYAGHWAETLNFQSEKFPRVTRFYRGQMTENEARDFLKANRIRWVVEGQFEKQFSQSISMAQKLGLKPIFQGGDAQNGTTVVFEVS